MSVTLYKSVVIDTGVCLCTESPGPRGSLEGFDAGRIYKFEAVDAPRGARVRIYPSYFDVEMPNDSFEVTTPAKFKRFFDEVPGCRWLLSLRDEIRSRWSVPQEIGAVFVGVREDGELVSCEVDEGPGVAGFHRLLGWLPGHPRPDLHADLLGAVI